MIFPKKSHLLHPEVVPQADQGPSGRFGSTAPAFPRAELATLPRKTCPSFKNCQVKAAFSHLDLDLPIFPNNNGDDS